MSNNPALPPPNMDDFEATMIREENPLGYGLAGEQQQAEQPADTPVKASELDGITVSMLKPLITQRREPYPPTPKPRRAKPNNMIWTYIALGAWFAIAGFIGAFLGTLAANIL